MNLPRLIMEKSDLAAVYAEDGAMHTAARVLRELADAVEQRAKEADAFIAAQLDEERADPFNPNGSGPVPIEPREG